MSGWCRSNDVKILKTSQQKDDDSVIARSAILKIMQTGGFFQWHRS